MKKFKVLITRKLPGDYFKLFVGENIQFEIFPEEDRPIKEAELLERIKYADGLLCLLTDKIDKEVIEIAKNLKVISNYAVGFDNIDVKKATEKNIIVTNTPGVLTDATADLTIALTLSLVRRIPEADRFVREGKFIGWSPTLLIGGDLKGKNFAVLGAGRIGREVANRAKGFYMNILYHSRRRKPDFEKKYHAEFKELDELLKIADILSIHLPLTEQTHHIINSDRLKMLKSSSYIVNTSRGAVIDEKALITTLENRSIAGAALDVFEYEPEVSIKMKTLSNVVLAPHIGSASKSAREKMAEMAVVNLIKALKGEIPKNTVNKEVLLK